MTWKLPVAAEKEYGPTDRIYIYDADRKCIMRLNRTDDPAFDYALACEIAEVINANVQDKLAEFVAPRREE